MRDGRNPTRHLRPTLARIRTPRRSRDLRSEDRGQWDRGPWGYHTFRLRPGSLRFQVQAPPDSWDLRARGKNGAAVWADNYPRGGSDQLQHESQAENNRYRSEDRHPAQQADCPEKEDQNE